MTKSQVRNLLNVPASQFENALACIPQCDLSSELFDEECTEFDILADDGLLSYRLTSIATCGEYVPHRAQVIREI